MVKTQDEKMKLPYSLPRDTIKIFKLIHERKEPTPINKEKLKVHQIGNPVYVIALLKTLGFLDENSKLDSCAEDLRGTGKDFTKCLEGKVKEIYKDLFNTVKEAMNPEEEIKVEEYFKTHVKDVKASMLQRVTNCFLTLRNIVNSDGDFKSLESKPSKEGKKEEEIRKPSKITKEEKIELDKFQYKKINIILNLNIDIDIRTPEEAIGDLFKKISAAHKAVFGEIT